MPPTDDGPDYTGQQYTTANDLASRRAMADALIRQSTTPYVGQSGPFQVVSPWGGGAMMAQALAGKMMLNRARDQELGMVQRLTPASAPLSDEDVRGGYGQPATAPAPGPQSQAETAGPQQTALSAPPSGMTRPWANYLPTYAAIEGTARTGKYAGPYQLGPEDRRRYGNNYLAYWQDKANEFQRVYGRQPTGAELYLVHQQGLGGFQAHMSNPDAPAWQNMASTAEGKQKGAGWAQQAIWGNVPDSMKQQFGSVNNITSRQFANMWDQRVETGRFDHSGGIGHADAGQGAQPVKVALNGPMAGLGAPGVQAPAAPTGGDQGQVQMAAGRGPAGAPGTAGTKAAPSPDDYVRGADIPPNYFPTQPRISRKQFQYNTQFGNMFGYPKEQMERDAGAYYNYGQPMQMQGTFGPVIYDPRRGTSTQIPQLHMVPQKGMEGVETQVPTIPVPDGKGGITTITPGASTGGTTGAGRTEPGPSTSPPDLVPPKAQPQSAPAPVPSGGQPRAQDIRLNGGMFEKPPVVNADFRMPDKEAPKVQLASLNGLEPGMLGSSPPKAGAEGKSAQISPQIRELTDYGIAKKRQIEENTADVKQYNDDYKKWREMSLEAENLDKEFAVAEQIAKDPRFKEISGPGADLKIGVNKALSFLGNEKSTERVGLVQAFQKATSSQILDQMREKLGGLGQVRNKEIDLMTMALASPHNTFAANMAILDMNRRFQKQAMELGHILDSYNQGWRWDDKGHVRGQFPDAARTSGEQAEIAKMYLKTHPLYTDDEIKHYTDVFKADQESTQTPSASSSGPAQTLKSLPPNSTLK